MVDPACLSLDGSMPDRINRKKMGKGGNDNTNTEWGTLLDCIAELVSAGALYHSVEVEVEGEGEDDDFPNFDFGKRGLYEDEPMNYEQAMSESFALVLPQRDSGYLTSIKFLKDIVEEGKGGEQAQIICSRLAWNNEGLSEKVRHGEPAVRSEATSC